MNIIYTSEYPIRYVAFEKERTWIIGDDAHKKEWGEKAVYSDLSQNPNYSYLGNVSGFFIEIGHHQGLNAPYYLQCFYESPSISRTQKTYCEKCESLEIAIDKAERWMETIRKREHSNEQKHL